MVRLSVNINKIATLRNARGGNSPNLVKAAVDCQKFGADGITIHPRPDERHITANDVFELKPIIKSEYNIEGYPSENFLKMVLEVKPEQVTLVPDKPDVLTSFAGWDTIKHRVFLKEVITLLKENKIRTSIFVDPVKSIIEGAKNCTADRIELYTGDYAKSYFANKKKAIKHYVMAANIAHSLGLGINAGHDLNLDNLQFFAQQIPNLAEVSIGHALICDAIYLGLENTIQMYKRLL
ncbi:MAG: pyridoxine 5'-phosphate synthase [Flavobacteriales bacterium]|nr:pyridoxine 5'-phosphate synthase [Flavobacteriales bacterium]